jgi:hypothetical protein
VSPHINLNGQRRHKLGFVTNIAAGFFIRCLRIIDMFETELISPRQDVPYKSLVLTALKRYQSIKTVLEYF